MGSKSRFSKGNFQKSSCLKLQGPELSSRGPLPKLLKLCPWGQNWPCPGCRNFTFDLFLRWVTQGPLGPHYILWCVLNSCMIWKKFTAEIWREMVLLANCRNPIKEKNQCWKSYNCIVSLKNKSNFFFEWQILSFFYWNGLDLLTL